jgi:beta-galactosidase
MKKVLIFALCLLTLNQLVAFNQQSERLNHNWKFLKGDLGGIWEAVRPVKFGDPESVPVWEKVTLPHSYNASDAVDPDVHYYQGPAWYRTTLAIQNPNKNGRVLLHFEGAGQKSEVYVYTTKVGTHVGGYDEWTVDITDAVDEFTKNEKLMKQFGGKVPVAIRTDNSRDLEMMPSDLSDFNLYGGIYRYLNLVYVPASYVEQFHINASVDVKGAVGKMAIDLKVKDTYSLNKAALTIEIFDPNGKRVVSETSTIETLRTFKSVYSTEIKKPALWSPDQPALYKCRLTLTTEHGTHVVNDNFGFRHIEFVEKGPFKINGKRLLLKGTHRHEDHAAVGAAMTEEMMRKEIMLMKEMGVNFLRLGHHQQSRIILNLCDSLGILVWEEIPWCRGGLGGEIYREQGRRMLTNMINQHKNHPSIFLWGLGNENDWPGDYAEFDKQKIRAYMSELHLLSHQLDPSRLTAIRRCDFCKDIPDVYSPSIWAGWYRGIYAEYKPMSEYHINTLRHFLHVEWGGDSHAGRFSEDAEEITRRVITDGSVDERRGDASLYGGPTRVSKDGDWSESYICNLFEWHLKEQETMPNLTGTAFWIFKDFSTPIRPDNPVPYMNQKGVVERDLTPKEAFYVFQSYWIERPMARIFGHNWPVRWGDAGEAKEVKVYSNCDEAELFVNGISQGVKKRNSQDFPAAGLRWNVVYNEGDNQLKVVARKGKTVVTDEMNQRYQTAKWGEPAYMTLEKVDGRRGETSQEKGAAIPGDDAANNETLTIEVKLFDANGIQCLDSRKVVRFALLGDGHLIDNQGTSTGARVVELYNGRAQISINTKGAKNIASVSSEGLKTVFCEL